MPSLGAWLGGGGVVVGGAFGLAPEPLLVEKIRRDLDGIDRRIIGPERQVLVAILNIIRQC